MYDIIAFHIFNLDDKEDKESMDRKLSSEFDRSEAPLLLYLYISMYIYIYIYMYIYIYLYTYTYVGLLSSSKESYCSKYLITIGNVYLDFEHGLCTRIYILIV
jgi:hypothetical protein